MELNSVCSVGHRGSSPYEDIMSWEQQQKDVYALPDHPSASPP